jgi:MerR family transcriptional regulator, activator of bmr gene
MVKELFSIGEVAKLKGLTIKALRYYEKIGLLQPFYINPVSKYRYYRIDQFLKIEFISMFRKAGVDVCELSGIFTDDNAVQIAQFSEMHTEIAQKKIRELENSILLFRELNKKISSDRRLPENVDTYIKKLGKRHIIKSSLDRSPMDYSVYDNYFNVYSLIRRKGFLTVYATGTIIDIDLESLEIKYKNMYIEVLPANLSTNDPLDVIPEGNYLCVNFFQCNQEAQLAKLAASLVKMKARPNLILQVDTFYDVVNYKNPLAEVQCLLEE